MQTVKVCMLTSVHTPWDTRIYHCEAKSLARAGYDVTLISTEVNSQKASFEDANIVGLNRPERRLGRARNWFPFAKAALKTEADIYHFHDPDLLFVGLWLQRHTGRPVIYDCHEPYELKILDREWLPQPTKPLISLSYRMVERWIVDRLSAIIVPNDKQLLRYPDAILVRNLPRRRLALSEPRQSFSGRQVIYLGLVNQVRGAWNMLRALDQISLPDSELILVGRIDTQNLEQKIIAYVHSHGLEKRVKLVGHKPYESLPKYLTQATVGLIAFENVPSLHIAIPTKLFEYMSFGLPVVASDLPPIRPFIKQAQCGILVSPSDISDLAAAIEYLFRHPAEAWELGENGRQAIIDRYNWEAEERKLLSLYEELLN